VLVSRHVRGPPPARAVDGEQRRLPRRSQRQTRDVSAEQIRHARLCGAGYTPVPLSTPTGNDGSLELGDALGDPDPDLEILTDKLAVTELVHLLPQRIQRMLALRFFGNLAQAQIAAEFNLSQMQVSRLLTRC